MEFCLCLSSMRESQNEGVWAGHVAEGIWHRRSRAFSQATVIMRVIERIGVIAHLCDENPSYESFNSISAQVSESSHRGAMAPT